MAAELARRGYVSTTFTGNVQHYDIIASNNRGRHATVQVKAIRGASWVFSVSAFCEIEFSGSKQVIRRSKRCPIPGLVCVLVALREYGQDRFFICRWEKLRDLVVTGHRRYLEKHGGQRPKNPRSLHAALPLAKVEPFEGNWALIGEVLR